MKSLGKYRPWKLLLPLLWIVSTVALSGCGEDERIRVYRVAKEDKIPRRVLEPSSGAPQRMLAAIVPHGDAAWFFKLQAAPDVANKHRGEFEAIIRSIRFEASDVPSWELPPEWTQHFEQGITYARLQKPSEGIELTVTRLPVSGRDDTERWRQYVTDNVNRWRRQLGLPPLDWAEIEPQLHEITELKDGQRAAYIVELEGQASGGGMRAPFMSGAPPMAHPTSTATAPPHPPVKSSAEPEPSTGTDDRVASAGQRAASASSLQFQVPDGWSPLDVSSSSMRLAAFALNKDNGTGEVTLVPAGGDIRDNVRIWLGQIGVPADDAATEAVVESAEQVQVGDVTARIYWVDGARHGRDESILVAAVPRGQQETLYVKLKGNARLVEAERSNFQRFVESLRW